MREKIFDIVITRIIKLSKAFIIVAQDNDRLSLNKERTEISHTHTHPSSNNNDFRNYICLFDRLT